ncbi:response regulator [Flavisolibacter ginsengisoli]|jgi:CheY-like chemotaxis protein|uniref:CheY chemotaxis protein or a CheY-like REC (Receiver) domain n=1 Tax=Flavisolibacter ginsengisoli DSM 18119 TaxID=1121884 RepID=A0A1M4SA99_9BACT|nr:response regulator [Flavisolibacter ginsengisoli]SHE29112.1 CheY chemotaxis protein or a CheY-like REC (receiver) domain [Flavisolibacter ginsengisoli DSM 18119]
MSRITTILLVEDDQLDAMDIKRSLDKLNVLYKLVVAKNGEEAIDMMKGNHEVTLENLPDIILIDINMPRMNGLEFLQVIRDTPEWKKIKCFMITTSDEKVDKEAAKKLGVSGYILKPFKINNTSSLDSFNLVIDLMNMKGYE